MRLRTFETGRSSSKKCGGGLNVVTKMLRKENITLSEARMIAEELIKTIDKYKNNPPSKLYECDMEQKYLLQNSDIVKYPAFESGVCKIQRNEAHLMDEEERDACSMLRVDASDNIRPQEEDATASLSDRIANKRRKLNNSSGKYRDCSFILGSVAVAERLWSIADRILPDHRKDASPIAFEALLYLRVISPYWNVHTAKEAMRMNRSESVNRRMLKMVTNLMMSKFTLSPNCKEVILDLAVQRERTTIGYRVRTRTNMTVKHRSLNQKQ